MFGLGNWKDKQLKKLEKNFPHIQQIATASLFAKNVIEMLKEEFVVSGGSEKAKLLEMFYYGNIEADVRKTFGFGWANRKELLAYITMSAYYIAVLKEEVSNNYEGNSYIDDIQQSFISQKDGTPSFKCRELGWQYADSDCSDESVIEELKEIVKTS